MFYKLLPILSATFLLTSSVTGKSDKYNLKQENIADADAETADSRLTADVVKADNSSDGEYFAYPKYKYSYDVGDDKTGDYKTHVEERDGDSVRGEYKITENGVVRSVKYTADGKHGYQAVVSSTDIRHPSAFESPSSDGSTTKHDDYPVSDSPTSASVNQFISTLEDPRSTKRHHPFTKAYTLASVSVGHSETTDEEQTTEYLTRKRYGFYKKPAPFSEYIAGSDPAETAKTFHSDTPALAPATYSVRTEHIADDSLKKHYARYPTVNTYLDSPVSESVASINPPTTYAKVTPYSDSDKTVEATTERENYKFQKKQHGRITSIYADTPTTDSISYSIGRTENGYQSPKKLHHYAKTESATPSIEEYNSGDSHKTVHDRYINSEPNKPHRYVKAELAGPTYEEYISHKRANLHSESGNEEHIRNHPHRKPNDRYLDSPAVETAAHLQLTTAEQTGGASSNFHHVNPYAQIGQATDDLLGVPRRKIRLLKKKQRKNEQDHHATPETADADTSVSPKGFVDNYVPNEGHTPENLEGGTIIHHGGSEASADKYISTSYSSQYIPTASNVYQSSNNQHPELEAPSSNAYHSPTLKSSKIQHHLSAPSSTASNVQNYPLGYLPTADTLHPVASKLPEIATTDDSYHPISSKLHNYPTTLYSTASKVQEIPSANDFLHPTNSQLPTKSTTYDKQQEIAITNDFHHATTSKLHEIPTTFDIRHPTTSKLPLTSDFQHRITSKLENLPSTSKTQNVHEIPKTSRPPFDSKYEDSLQATKLQHPQSGSKQHQHHSTNYQQNYIPTTTTIHYGQSSSPSMKNPTSYVHVYRKETPAYQQTRNYPENHRNDEDLHTFASTHHENIQEIHSESSDRLNHLSHSESSDTLRGEADTLSTTLNTLSHHRHQNNARKRKQRGQNKQRTSSKPEDADHDSLTNQLKNQHQTFEAQKNEDKFSGVISSANSGYRDYGLNSNQPEIKQSHESLKTYDARTNQLNLPKDPETNLYSYVQDYETPESEFVPEPFEAQKIRQQPAPDHGNLNAETYYRPKIIANAPNSINIQHFSIDNPRKQQSKTIEDYAQVPEVTTLQQAHVNPENYYYHNNVVANSNKQQLVQNPAKQFYGGVHQKPYQAVQKYEQLQNSNQHNSDDQSIGNQQGSTIQNNQQVFSQIKHPNVGSSNIRQADDNQGGHSYAQVNIQHHPSVSYNIVNHEANLEPQINLQETVGNQNPHNKAPVNEQPFSINDEKNQNTKNAETLDSSGVLKYEDVDQTKEQLDSSGVTNFESNTNTKAFSFKGAEAPKYQDVAQMNTQEYSSGVPIVEEINAHKYYGNPNTISAEANPSRSPQSYVQVKLQRNPSYEIKYEQAADSKPSTYNREGQEIFTSSNYHAGAQIGAPDVAQSHNYQAPQGFTVSKYNIGTPKDSLQSNYEGSTVLNYNIGTRKNAQHAAPPNYEPAQSNTALNYNIGAPEPSKLSITSNYHAQEAPQSYVQVSVDQGHSYPVEVQNNEPIGDTTHQINDAVSAKLVGDPGLTSSQKSRHEMGSQAALQRPKVSTLNHISGTTEKFVPINYSVGAREASQIYNVEKPEVSQNYQAGESNYPQSYVQVSVDNYPIDQNKNGQLIHQANSNVLHDSNQARYQPSTPATIVGNINHAHYQPSTPEPDAMNYHYAAVGTIEHNRESQSYQQSTTAPTVIGSANHVQYQPSTPGAFIAHNPERPEHTYGYETQHQTLSDTDPQVNQEDLLQQIYSTLQKTVQETQLKSSRPETTLDQTIPTGKSPNQQVPVYYTKYTNVYHPLYSNIGDAQNGDLNQGNKFNQASDAAKPIYGILDPNQIVNFAQGSQHLGVQLGQDAAKPVYGAVGTDHAQGNQNYIDQNHGFTKGPNYVPANHKPVYGNIDASHVSGLDQENQKPFYGRIETNFKQIYGKTHTTSGSQVEEPTIVHGNAALNQANNFGHDGYKPVASHSSTEGQTEQTPNYGNIGIAATSSGPKIVYQNLPSNHGGYKPVATHSPSEGQLEQTLNYGNVGIGANRGPKIVYQNLTPNQDNVGQTNYKPVHATSSDQGWQPTEYATNIQNQAANLLPDKPVYTKRDPNEPKQQKPGAHETHKPNYQPSNQVYESLSGKMNPPFPQNNDEVSYSALSSGGFKPFNPSVGSRYNSNKMYDHDEGFKPMDVGPQVETGKQNLGQKLGGFHRKGRNAVHPRVDGRKKKLSSA